jgi:hypothetical protein
MTRSPEPFLLSCTAALPTIALMGWYIATARTEHITAGSRKFEMPSPRLSYWPTFVSGGTKMLCELPQSVVQMNAIKPGLPPNGIISATGRISRPHRWHIT